MIDTVDLTRALIRCASVTPADDGALGMLERALGPMGFRCWRLPFEEPGTYPVDNLFARLGDGPPHLCFAGHTDVVPPGDTTAWQTDPFGAVVRDGAVWGRGAVDMKGSIAAFVAALDRVLATDGRPQGSLSLLITGDEEGDAVNGTRKVLAWMAENGHVPDACLVGEPTNPENLGDAIKIGRRGSLTAFLTVPGRQGHSAYPHLADNAANRLTRALAALLEAPLDTGSEHFEPSNLEITTMDVGNPATNVIPGRATATVNVRFNDRHTGAALADRIRQTVLIHAPRAEIAIRVSAESFLTPPGRLSDLVAGAVMRTTGRRPTLGTAGGTSDARFIKDYCPVVEYGGVGRTMHQVDEHTRIADLQGLTDTYQALVTSFLSDWP